MIWLQRFLRAFGSTRPKDVLEKQVIDAAKSFFVRTYPTDRICWVNIPEQNEKYFVVGITYEAMVIPTPSRFFRVAIPGLGVEELPKDYWPKHWPPSR